MSPGVEETEKKYYFSDIRPFLGSDFELSGDGQNLFFTNCKPLAEAAADSLVWVSPSMADQEEIITNSPARIIICGKSVSSKSKKCLIKVSNPRLVYSRIVKNLFVTLPLGVHPTALIDKDAVLGNNIYIGPYTVVGKVRIGSYVRIESNCKVEDNARIGDRVVIGSGTIIGHNGFGYVKNEKGTYEHFPHIGKVVIEEGVDIGANSCVVKGVLGSTIIRKGAKIDCFVQIGHNAEIKENVLIHAQSTIGGSAVIGRNSIISMGVTVLNKLVIGENANIGPGTVIMSNVRDGAKLVGRPAMPLPQ